MGNRLALIVSGDRHATKDRATRYRWEMALYPVLRDLDDRYDEVVLIHGACGQDISPDGMAVGAMKGIDLIADTLGRALKWSVLSMPANWRALGIGAGPTRNEWMVAVQDRLGFAGYDRYLIGCHDDVARSKGTRHAIDLARRGNVPHLHLTSERADDGR